MTARIYYFEDLPPGTVLEFGGVEMTEEEIVGFAKRYDPQPFHVDREAGKASIFGGLCASGWNTTAVMMRMWVDNYLSPEASLGSPGIDELRWLKPCLPGRPAALSPDGDRCDAVAEPLVHGQRSPAGGGAQSEGRGSAES